MEGLEPSFSLQLSVPRTYHPRRRGPSEGHTFVLGCPDIESPIWDDRESKARSCPDPERPHASPMPVVEDERLDPSYLLEPPDPPEQIPCCKRPPIQGNLAFRHHPHTTPSQYSRALALSLDSIVLTGLYLTAL